MTAHRSSEDFDAVLTNLAEEALAECQVGVCLLEQGKVLLKHSLAISSAHLPDPESCQSQSIVLCYPW